MNQQTKGKMTIRDIAGFCDVSVQTVSRVINNRQEVSPETRKKVQAAIKKYGFTPNAVARSLVSKRSHSIGVIIGDLNYISVAYTLNGINEGCKQIGYSVIINELFQNEADDITPLVAALVGNQVEGIIYAASDINNSVQHVQSHLPVFCPPIIFLKCAANPSFATISVNNYGGACKAVEHLISEGCTHIAHISGPLSWLESRQRKQGWEDTLKKHGLPFSENACLEGDWKSTSGKALIPLLLDQYPEMDGVFVSNDEMSMGVINYANRNGIDIPGRFALVGFDDQNESPLFSPSITTVSHPMREMGNLAAHTLHSMLYNPDETYKPVQLLLEPELIIRESSIRE